MKNIYCKLDSKKFSNLNSSFSNFINFEDIIRQAKKIKLFDLAIHCLKYVIGDKRIIW